MQQLTKLFDGFTKQQFRGSCWWCNTTRNFLMLIIFTNLVLDANSFSGHYTKLRETTKQSNLHHNRFRFRWHLQQRRLSDIETVESTLGQNQGALPTDSLIEYDNESTISFTNPTELVTDEVPELKNVGLFSNKETATMLALLWVIAMISSIDRVAMSVALVPMSSEFDFTDTTKGSISSLFSLGYGLTIIPAGLLAASASPRVVLACGIALWSITTLLTPSTAALMTASIGATIVPLLLVRAFVGVGESLFLPTTQRILSVWTNQDQKGFAIAFIFSGFKTGTIVAYLLSPIIMDAFGGWRALFYIYGGVGLAIMSAWLLFAIDSPTESTSQKSQAILRPSTGGTFQSSVLGPDGSETSSKSSAWEQSIQTLQEAPWIDMLQSKGVWAMLLAHSAKNWALYNTLSWTPTFYAEEYGIGVRESAFLSIVPSIAGVVGGFVAGTTADAIIRKIQEDSGKEIEVDVKSNVRKVFQGVSLYGGALALGALSLNIPEEAWVAQIYLTVSVCLQAFGAAGFEGGNQDKAGEKWAGLLYSVTSLPAVLFGTLGVWITGRVLDITNQDWSYVFSITAGINILGATAFLLLYDSKKEFD